ncbi:hypothetical protein CR513_53414, partial [Mucuna pruriens]
MDEIHHDICRFHSSECTMASRLPECEGHDLVDHSSAKELQSITFAWPFSIWGMDILGLFPMAKGQVKFLLIVVDYFTKSIEVELLAPSPHKRSNDSYGNTSYEVRALPLGGDRQWHPVHKKFPTQILRRTRHQPQAFGTIAMIPIKVGEPSVRQNDFNPNDNSDAIRTDLDLVKKVREQVCIRQEVCRKRVARRYKSKLRPRDFREEDLVWRKTRGVRERKEDDKFIAN